MNKLENFKGNRNTNGLNKNPANINKKGRPRGSRNRTTIVKEWLELETESTNLQGEPVKLPIADQLVLSMIAKALKGDVNAYKELMDAAYGKIEEQTNIKYNKESHRQQIAALFPTEEEFKAMAKEND